LALFLGIHDICGAFEWPNRIFFVKEEIYCTVSLPTIYLLISFFSPLWIHLSAYRALVARPDFGKDQSFPTSDVSSVFVVLCLWLSYLVPTLNTRGRGPLLSIFTTVRTSHCNPASAYFTSFAINRYTLRDAADCGGQVRVSEGKTATGYMHIYAWMRLSILKGGQLCIKPQNRICTG
jgi:hypothetical protein